MRYLAGIIGLGALATVGLSGETLAQDLIYSNAQTANCLANSEMPEEFTSCVGRSSEACMNANSLGGSTIGMGGCLNYEYEFWDARLNHVYQRVMANAKENDAYNASEGLGAPPSAPALRDMQRAWIPFRDARCRYEHTLWAGGTGGGPAVVACLMDVTAEQTLFLEQTLN